VKGHEEAASVLFNETKYKMVHRTNLLIIRKNIDLTVFCYLLP